MRNSETLLRTVQKQAIIWTVISKTTGSEWIEKYGIGIKGKRRNNRFSSCEGNSKIPRLTDNSSERGVLLLFNEYFFMFSLL